MGISLRGWEKQMAAHESSLDYFYFLSEMKGEAFSWDELWEGGGQLERREGGVNYSSCNGGVNWLRERGGCDNQCYRLTGVTKWRQVILVVCFSLTTFQLCGYGAVKWIWQNKRGAKESTMPMKDYSNNGPRNLMREWTSEMMTGFMIPM